ncbi:hypothetical protein EV424DRAFT_1425539 [Suillus variegatus]|nr:hypothetical protein EV424DRAFT_1425539 [Suillus variegatus]
MIELSAPQEMAQFTTTSVTYPLAKYSHAEWQHFVHPVINLYLDAKKSSAGDLVSVRFRVVWNFDGNTNSVGVDQREIILLNVNPPGGS